jgi:hypothetical protein
VLTSSGARRRRRVPRHHLLDERPQRLGRIQRLGAHAPHQHRVVIELEQVAPREALGAAREVVDRAPARGRPAMSAPMLVPAKRLGRTPRSSRARNTPMWANP